MSSGVDDVDWRCLEFLVWPGIGLDADAHNSSVAENIPSLCSELPPNLLIRPDSLHSL